MTAPECRKPSTSGRSCIQSLAAGWITTPDLCATCTQTFMRALGAVVPNLEWHPNYRQRAVETVGVES